VAVTPLISGPAGAHEDPAKNAPAPMVDARAEPAVAVLESFASAYEAGDIEALRRLVVADESFSHFEGSSADFGWESYAAHMMAEMPSFSETRYRLSEIRASASADVAFATFAWSMQVVVLSDRFPDGRHPVAMEGLGTAVIVRGPDGWKLQHLQTARAPAPKDGG
jgi:ketosteroid isomerase-like protein